MALTTAFQVVNTFLLLFNKRLLKIAFHVLILNLLSLPFVTESFVEIAIIWATFNMTDVQLSVILLIFFIFPMCYQ